MLPAILKQSRYGKIGFLLLLLVVGGVLFFGLARMNAPTPAPVAGADGRYDVGTNPTRQMKGFVDHFGNLVDRQGKDLAVQTTQLELLKRENTELRKGTGTLREELDQLKAAVRARNEADDPVKRTVEDLKQRFGPEGVERPAAGEAGDKATPEQVQRHRVRIYGCSRFRPTNV